MANGEWQRVSIRRLTVGDVIEVMPGDGPGAIVRLQLGQDVILARITRRSAVALALGPGVTCFAILKSMSVARDHVGVATRTKKDVQ